MHLSMSEWEERLQRQQMSRNPQVEQHDDADDLTLSFIESMEEIKAEIESIKDSNGTLFTALQNMLNEIMMKNAEALIQANNQFMHLIMRKLDELEDRITSDEPAFTNVLYSSPELFNEISSREDADEPTKEDVKEDAYEYLEGSPMGEEKEVAPEEEIPADVIEAYNKYAGKQIKWTDFVKICGGVKLAGKYKRILSSSS